MQLVELNCRRFEFFLIFVHKNAHRKGTSPSLFIAVFTEISSSVAFFQNSVDRAAENAYNIIMNFNIILSSGV